MTRFFAGICGVDKADMKFKNKIIISFCIIIFVPVTLAALAMTVLSSVFRLAASSVPNTPPTPTLRQRVGVFVSSVSAAAAV